MLKTRSEFNGRWINGMDDSAENEARAWIASHKEIAEMNQYW